MVCGREGMDRAITGGARYQERRGEERERERERESQLIANSVGSKSYRIGLLSNFHPIDLPTPLVSVSPPKAYQGGPPPLWPPLLW